MEMFQCTGIITSAPLGTDELKTEDDSYPDRFCDFPQTLMSGRDSI
jgi:hypothetical protein